MRDPAALRVLAKAASALASAIDDSAKAADKRLALGTDCTRARIIAANVRWETAAEDRDRKRLAFCAALESFSDQGPPNDPN